MTESPISRTATYVRSELEGEGSGHDWWHIYRVWQNAKHIMKSETEADPLVVELAALLHDIADYKFHDGDETVGPRVAREWLEKIGVEESTITHVTDIIATLSFKGGTESSPMTTLEGQIVQDADRLDAIGAIGIARCFAYGGHKGREIYNPEIPSEQNMTKEQYKSNNSPSLNHFYEKLLLLKDLMNTDTAKQIAQARHQFMEQFLKQFYAEWEGES